VLSGQVTQGGNPLADVQVSLEGTYDVLTDETGQYTINLPKTGTTTSSSSIFSNPAIKYKGCRMF
jgi:hypothetical protein